MASIIVPKRSLILPRGSRGGLILPQSQRGFMVVNPARFGSIVPKAWNPADFAAELALSNSNKTATRSTTNDGSWRSGRSETSHSSGKFWAACRNDANGSTNGAMIFGVCDALASLSNYPGSDSHSWGNQANNPSVFFYMAGTAINESSGWTSIGVGGYAFVAVNFITNKLWFGTSATAGGGWGSGNDPSAGLGGFTIPSGLTLFLMLGQQRSPQQSTLLSSDADLAAAGLSLSGFNGWG